MKKETQPAKYCDDCDEWLPQTNEHWYKSKEGKFYPQCKPCYLARNRANKEARRAQGVLKEPEKIDHATRDAWRDKWVAVISIAPWTGARYHSSVAQSLTGGTVYQPTPKSCNMACLPDFNINRAKELV